jgi:hypothetical protein
LSKYDWWSNTALLNAILDSPAADSVVMTRKKNYRWTSPFKNYTENGLHNLCTKIAGSKEVEEFVSIFRELLNLSEEELISYATLYKLSE